ncbi:hypothetical protein HDU98_009709 [Podochytrium sp. JEL0797]|nr:hypothetical protein HDU98_009709 [Podochytrium sp. JEL0797]
MKMSPIHTVPMKRPTTSSIKSPTLTSPKRSTSSTTSPGITSTPTLTAPMKRPTSSITSPGIASTPTLAAPMTRPTSSITSPTFMAPKRPTSSSTSPIASTPTLTAPMKRPTLITSPKRPTSSSSIRSPTLLTSTKKHLTFKPTDLQTAKKRLHKIMAPGKPSSLLLRVPHPKKLAEIKKKLKAATTTVKNFVVVKTGTGSPASSPVLHKGVNSLAQSAMRGGGVFGAEIRLG